MMYVARVALVFSVATLSSCTGATGVPNALAPRVVRVPEHIGTYRLAEVHHFPFAAAGSVYRYRGESVLVPDVFIFPVTDKSPNPKDESEKLLVESQLLLDNLATQVTHGQIDSYVIRQKNLVLIVEEKNSIRGFHIHAVILRGTDFFETHQHLFLVGDAFVKVRSTFPHNAIPPDSVNAFAEGLLRAMVRPLSIK